MSGQGRTGLRCVAYDTMSTPPKKPCYPRFGPSTSSLHFKRQREQREEEAASVSTSNFMPVGCAVLAIDHDCVQPKASKPTLIKEKVVNSVELLTESSEQPFVYNLITFPEW